MFFWLTVASIFHLVEPHAREVEIGILMVTGEKGGDLSRLTVVPGGNIDIDIRNAIIEENGTSAGQGPDQDHHPPHPNQLYSLSILYKY